MSIDGGSHKSLSSSGKEVSPLADLDFEVKVENTYSSSSDEILDIDVTLTIEGADWDEDETEEIGDLDGDDSGEVNFEGIEVPGDVDNGDVYDLTIFAEGEDENSQQA